MPPSTRERITLDLERRREDIWSAATVAAAEVGAAWAPPLSISAHNPSCYTQPLHPTHPHHLLTRPIHARDHPSTHPPTHSPHPPVTGWRQHPRLSKSGPVGGGVKPGGEPHGGAGGLWPRLPQAARV